MKILFWLLGLAIAGIVLVAAAGVYKFNIKGDDVYLGPTALEKGGPVTATGYVDLIPPSNYSPIRGVLCESLTIVDGALSGACYDLSGPSVALTEKHISLQAAQALNTKIERGNFSNTKKFLMETNILCDLEKRQCRFSDNAVRGAGAYAPKHTKALFGFPSEYYQKDGP